jgi:FKBP-type peptidyl-prolyl cis-trans isomerase
MKNKQIQNMMIRIGRFRLLLFAFVLALAVSGCVTNDWAEKEQKEKDLISAYVKEHGITEDQKTQNGIYFIEEVHGTGLAPKKNDYVVINYTGRYIADNRIHETSYDSLKGEWDNADAYKYFVYGPLKFEYGFSIAGINEGLALMKEGGKAQLLIPSDKAFYDFNPMIYDIELLKVISNPAHDDSLVMDKYLTQVGLDSVNNYYEKTDVYVKVTHVENPGDNHYFQSKDTLYFKYSGKLLDSYGPTVTERVFDSNMQTDATVKYVHGQQSYEKGSFMLGFSTALRTSLDTLRYKSKATFVLPAIKAYGDKGLINSQFGYIIVPKYQTVVYDIEVVDLQTPAK